MSIRIKLAKTAQELEDVFALRRQVYVEEEGYFKDLSAPVIVDQFDAIPNVGNIIAYQEPEHIPVGTFRVNSDSELGLPSEESYDFQSYRDRLNQERKDQGDPPARLGSAGMLAITKPFRKRRDVFRGLLKMACDISRFWNCTHIIATVNAETSAIYKRLGWEFLSDKIWIPHINEDIYPVAIESEKLYAWAFDSIEDKSGVLNSFAGGFEWLALSSGSTIFNEGEKGDQAYLISSGVVTISHNANESQSGLAVSNLGRGTLFGEMPLIDNQPRAATAIAKTNVELVVLNRETFWQKIRDDQQCMGSVLRMLCDRVRESNSRALLYASDSERSRLDYFLNKLFAESTQSSRDATVWIAKVSREEFAGMARCSERAVDEFLREWEESGKLEITKKEFRFIQDVELN